MALKPVAVLVGTVVVGAGLGVGVGFGPLAGSDSVAASVLAAVSTYDCPAGAPQGELDGGDRVFATGRDASGAWLEVRDPRDRSGRVWVESRYVDADEATDELTTASCDDQGEVALPPGDDTTVTTTAVDTGDPGDAGSGERADDSGGGGGTGGGDSGGGGGGGGDGGGGGGGGVVDTTGPVIASASVTPTDVWELDGGGVTCGTNPRQAVANATASDPSGVFAVAATWSFAGVNETKAVPAVFGPFPYQTISNAPPYQVTVVVTFTAVDNAGNASTTTRSVVLHSTAECFG